MTLKLTLMRGRALMFTDTECGSQAGNTSKVPSLTFTWSVLYAVNSVTGGRKMAPEGTDREN
jgi:hypothetical protein